MWFLIFFFINFIQNSFDTWWGRNISEINVVLMFYSLEYKPVPSLDNYILVFVFDEHSYLRGKEEKHRFIWMKYKIHWEENKNDLMKNQSWQFDSLLMPSNNFDKYFSFL